MVKNHMNRVFRALLHLLSVTLFGMRLQMRQADLADWTNDIGIYHMAAYLRVWTTRLHFPQALE